MGYDYLFIESKKVRVSVGKRGWFHKPMRLHNGCLHEIKNLEFPCEHGYKDLESAQKVLLAYEFERDEENQDAEDETRSSIGHQPARGEDSGL